MIKFSTWWLDPENCTFEFAFRFLLNILQYDGVTPTVKNHIFGRLNWEVDEYFARLVCTNFENPKSFSTVLKIRHYFLLSHPAINPFLFMRNGVLLGSLNHDSSYSTAIFSLQVHRRF